MGKRRYGFGTQARVCVYVYVHTHIYIYIYTYMYIYICIYALLYITCICVYAYTSACIRIQERYHSQRGPGCARLPEGGPGLVLPLVDVRRIL